MLNRGSAVKSIDPSEIDLAGCRRVLLVRVNVRMGNLLLITPALGALRHALPHARLDVLCYEDYAPLLAHDPHVDRVIGFHRRMLCNPAALARLARTLRRERYDLVVEGSRGASCFGALLTGLSRGQYRAAAAGSRYRRFFNVHVPRRPNLEHKVDLLLAFLANLGVPPVTRTLNVVLTEGEHVRADAVWRELGLTPGDPTVGIIVGGRGPKRWPRRQLVQIVQHLQTRPGLAVVLFCGPEQRRQANRLRHDLIRPVIVAPQVAVREFAALLHRCTLVVAGDTGPMHLAAAVGVPTVAVFHATNAIHYAPRGPLHRAVQLHAKGNIEGLLGAIDEVLEQQDAGRISSTAVASAPF
jgi:ADP-heptose:LPS heptosyltransferase